ncbi:hypothetical protein GQ600_7981 [Phytophthora cactorum]|nr:hypothetical protein GQ600_7981 [Phytophthora cactorum]
MWVAVDECKGMPMLKARSGDSVTSPTSFTCCSSFASTMVFGNRHSLATVTNESCTTRKRRSSDTSDVVASASASSATAARDEEDAELRRLHTCAHTTCCSGAALTAKDESHMRPSRRVRKCSDDTQANR